MGKKEDEANKLRLKKQQEEKLAREKAKVAKEAVARVAVNAEIIKENQKRDEKARLRAVFLGTHVARIQRELKALEKRVLDLRAGNGNDTANCGDTDLNGDVIPGGSRKGAVAYNPKLPVNPHEVSIAHVNAQLVGFEFDGSFTSGAKYKTKDGVFIHL